MDDATNTSNDRTPRAGAGARRRGLLGVGLAALAASGPLARPALGQPAPGGSATDWPRQPVRYINLYAAGGANDINSRAWCQAMSQLTGQQFVVENRVGAGGTVGQDAIAKARPDGHTLGLGSVATLAIAPHVFPSLPYDPEKDFTYISGLYRQPNLLLVNNDVPARSVAELVALLKANPGKYSYAIGGIATTPHLAAELFKTRAGVDMPSVSYRGGAPALVDVMAGRVQVLVDNISGPIGAVRDGRVRAIAVTGLQRSPAAPDVPTLAESGFPGFDVTSWNGVVAPAGIPPAMLRHMNALARRALENPDVVRVYAEGGAETWPTTPEEYRAYRDRQTTLMAEIVKASGAKVE